MDVDKVDLVIGGYGTNTLLPAMPLIMERRRFFVGLMGLGVNNALIYPNYFAMIPTGPESTARIDIDLYNYRQSLPYVIARKTR
jgi:branched-chain amino acid transport system substrate-binding protein